MLALARSLGEGETAGLLAAAGRLHPVLLHVPIGAWVALLALEFAAWFLGLSETRRARGVLAWLAAISAAASFGSGLLLSREGAFDDAALDSHRNATLVFTLAACAAAVAHARWSLRGRGGAIYGLAVAAASAALVPAAHLGGSLTHGEGYLTAPLRPPSRPASAPAADPAAAPASGSFSRALPILAAKCGECHGAEQPKARLALLTASGIEAGGKNGPVVDRANPKESEILARIERPREEKGHMPPKSKPQLSEDERASLRAWILEGAPVAGGGVAAAAAAPAARPDPNEARSAAAAPRSDPRAVEALRQMLVHVQPLARDTGLLWVDFAASAGRLSEEELAGLLAPLAASLGEANLARTKAGPLVLAVLAKAPALRRLDLRHTDVDDAALGALAGHGALEELVLAESKVGDGSVATLLALPALKRLYLWGSSVSPEGLARLRGARAALVVDAGDAPGSAALAVEEPVKLRSDAPAPGAPEAPSAVPSAAAPVNASCPVSGQPVNPKYTILFEGRAIGFCCPNCPGKFWADPGAFKGKLPP